MLLLEEEEQPRSSTGGGIIYTILLLYQSSTTNTTLFCRRAKNALDAHVDHSHHHKSNFLLTLPAGRVLKAIDSPRNVNAAGAFLPHGPLCDVKATDSPSNLSAAALQCLRRSDDTHYVRTGCTGVFCCNLSYSACTGCSSLALE